MCKTVIGYVFGFHIHGCVLRFTFHTFSLFFFFFVCLARNFLKFNCEQYYSWVSQIILFSNFFIKNESNSTIYTFKNYFITVFSISTKISCIQIDPNCYSTNCLSFSYRLIIFSMLFTIWYLDSYNINCVILYGLRIFWNNNDGHEVIYDVAPTSMNLGQIVIQTHHFVPSPDTNALSCS